MRNASRRARLIRDFHDFCASRHRILRPSARFPRDAGSSNSNHRRALSEFRGVRTDLCQPVHVVDDPISLSIDGAKDRAESCAPRAAPLHVLPFLFWPSANPGTLWNGRWAGDSERAKSRDGRIDLASAALHAGEAVPAFRAS